MKAAISFWASAALLCATTTLAQDQGTSDPPSATTTLPAPSCTASLVTTLCNYPDPDEGTAVASGGRSDCWDYCNNHQPCDFVVFVPHNPSLGDGTCWLYPGRSFDASAGSSDCGNPYLEVYSKPECPTSTTPDACAATNSPTPVAEICGYPEPLDNCWSTCTASLGAVDCLSQCVEADSCSYAVFNPHNPSNSPWYDGSCWMYPNGTYDAGAATTTCSGAPEQYVYTNPCPKPSSSPSASPSSSTPSESSSASSTSPSVDPSSDPYAFPSSSPSETSASPSSGSYGSSGSSSGSSGSSASSSPSSSHSSSASSAATSGKGTTGAAANYTSGSEKLATTGISLLNTLALGMSVLIWQGF